MNKTNIIKFFLILYFFCLLIMSIVRCLFYISTKPENFSWIEIIVAFRKGIMFDSLISAYILTLPILAVFIYSFFNKTFGKTITTFLKIYMCIMLIVVLSIFFSDIPYFKYFNEHLPPSALEYLSYFSTTSGMILGEKSYWLFLGLFILFCLVVVYSINKIFKKYFDGKPVLKPGKSFIFVFILLFALDFIGIRGSLERYPLRLSNASFSNKNYLNQLGLNPIFYLIKTFEAQKKGYNSIKDQIKLDEAYRMVQNELKVDEFSQYSISRKVIFEEPMEKPNVVIILSESLSSDYLQMKQQNGKPFLNFVHELIGKSYYFENFYSSGIHTNNGIFSTLYGFPAIFNRPSLQNKENFYTGIPYYLKKNGYKNYFFITGNGNYDNMNGFLYGSGSFDKVYSSDDYPIEKNANNFGIQDDYLFEFGIQELTKISTSGQPFLATFLTVSNHPPYIIPEKYVSTAENPEDQIMVYADDSLRYFFENTMKKKWAENTIFVLVGDHGKIIGNQIYPMSLGYNHIPMMIYSKKTEFQPRKISGFGGQIDIFPTLMGMMKIPYINNSLGIDLLKDSRKAMSFVSNTHLGTVNDSLFYYFDAQSKTEGLYRYKKRETENLITIYPREAEKLKKYGFSLIAVAEDQILNRNSNNTLKLFIK